MERNKIVSSIVEITGIAPGVSGQIDYDILTPNKDVKIKSITWDIVLIKTNAPRAIVPFAMNTKQEVQLGLSAYGAPLAELASATVPAGLMPANSTSIVFFTPGQRFYDAFYFPSNIHVTFSYTNNEAADTYRYTSTVIIEYIEESDL